MQCHSGRQIIRIHGSQGITMLINNQYLDERYEILKLIDTGGTSQVYLAMDRRVNKEWAIKKVRKKSAAINTVMAEVNVLKQLEHPALPKIIDIEEDADFFYVVMDYIRGENLRTIVRVAGPQDQDTVVAWGIELCNVISYLHSRNIVYRDMKPSNVMLTPEGKLILIDFGIAREYDPNVANDTVSLGTEGYAAPEQYEGHGQTDARTDIYGIGVTLFNLLTGINPLTHKGNTFSVRLARPNLSSGLDKIILKCTNKDRSQRYQTVEELKQALLHYKDYDNETIRIRNARKKLYTAFFCLSAVFFIASGLMLFLNKQQADNKYESLLSDTQNTKQIEKAIELKPEDPRGYLTLLDAYGEEFDQQEASEFSHVFAEHQSEINDKSEVAMTAGEKILSSYSEPSLRGKLLIAEPYFKAVEDSYEKFPAANAYTKLASFYKDFVMQGEGSLIKEADKKEYEELLSGMTTILDSVSEYKGTEQKNLYLTASELCLGLISEQAQPMKEQGIKKKELTAILDSIKTESSKIDPKIDAVKIKKDQVLAETEEVNATLNAVYSEKTEERSGKDV